MGAIANAMVAYAQPLIDSTDGSLEGMNRAMTLSSAFWNIALLPADQQDEMIDKMRETLEMSDQEFGEFRQQVVVPMIQRHREMFPAMHARSAQASPTRREPSSPTSTRPATSRNAPCPCGSGLKYKRCCGSRR